MNVQEIFVKNKDQLLFSDDSKIIKLREDILKKFTKEYFNKKNNESIKLVDLSILDKLNYNFHNKKIFSSIKIKNNNFYELNIVNGLFQNFCNKNIFLTCRVQIFPHNLEVHYMRPLYLHTFQMQ